MALSEYWLTAIRRPQGGWQVQSEDLGLLAIDETMHGAYVKALSVCYTLAAALGLGPKLIYLQVAEVA